MKIGFVGLGAMGRHMAASLVRAGHQLRVFDLRADAMKAFPHPCPSIGDAVKGVEVVFTSLPGPSDVERASVEILSAAAPGTAWFDTTTNSPTVVRKLHALCEQKEIHLLDAPVSGGPLGAETGKLALWIGGDEAVYKRLLPVLKAVGDEPFYVGPIGAGSVAKLVHNSAGFMVQAALAEAFTLGVKAGVEPVALLRAVRQGALGRKRVFDRLVDQFLPGHYDPPSFALRLGQKDMRLALELARECQVPMKMGDLAMAQLDEAMARGWAERDSRIIMHLQEERARVSVRVPQEQLQAIRKEIQ